MPSGNIFLNMLTVVLFLGIMLHHVPGESSFRTAFEL